MNGEFRCSVVVPCHDGMPDLLDALGTALAQTLPPHEVILVDDGSTDGSAQAAIDRFGDRVRVLTGRWGGAAAARNAGCQAASGEWIALLDADDLWFESKLATAAESLAANPQAGWFFSDGAFRTLDGQLHASWFGLYADLVEPYVGCPVAELCEVNFILTSSVVVRRELIEAAGGFDETLSHAEDLDLWIRLARRSPAVGVRRALVRYQHREGGLTRQLEHRLQGGMRLFSRLARDPELSPQIRRRARRREALYRWKLGLAAVREGRTREARGQFLASWMFPEHAWPAAIGVFATFVPPALFARLRRQETAVRMATPLAAVRRVHLAGVVDAIDPAPGAGAVEVPR